MLNQKSAEVIVETTRRTEY